VRNRSGQWWRPLLDARWVVFLVVATVAVFSFIVSYSHIYDLGRVHAQSGTAARLLPLTVDLLIVASSLVLFIQDRPSLDRKSLAFWMPRLVLYAAIGATVAANVAYGLPFGWLSAVISGWPGVAFVAAVEVGILVARPDERGRGASAQETSPAASPRASLPTVRGIQDRQKCSPTTAKKIRAEVAADRRSRGGNPSVSPAAPAAQGVPAGQFPPLPAGTQDSPAGNPNHPRSVPAGVNGKAVP